MLAGPEQAGQFGDFADKRAGRVHDLQTVFLYIVVSTGFF